jgi:Zn-dependent protease with chaperone function
MIAMIGRPNALDREVTALSDRALLTQPAPSLLDPARAAAAAHLEQFHIPVWTVMIVLQIAVLLWFWTSGRSARLRDYLRSTLRSEFLVRFCYGAALALLGKLAALIPQALSYRFERLMDLNALLFRTWLLEWIGSTLIAMLVAGLIAAVVLWLADRTHQWYVYTIAAVVGCTLLVSYANPFVIAPAYTKVVPFAPTRALARDIATIESRTGIHVPILEAQFDAHTRIGAAYVIGWGGSQRAVISDTLLAGATEPEMRFVIARLVAWVAANNGLHVALVESAFFVVGTALAVFIADRIGFRRDDDPVSRLALLGAVMGCVYLIALPFYNSYIRNVDLATDLAAVTLADQTWGGNSRAPAIRLEVREADQALRPACYGTFAYWYFAPHAGVGQRISMLQGRANVCATRRP